MNSKRNSCKIGVVIWLVGLCTVFAGPSDGFKSANELYDAGKFAEAAAVYEKIEPKTAHVYYNLGNAHFREGKLGLAILDYERARRLAPRDPDIVANLKFAEQRLGVDDVNAPPRAWQRFLRLIIESRSPDEWGMYELAALWLTALAVGLCIYIPRLRTDCLGLRRRPSWDSRPPRLRLAMKSSVIERLPRRSLWPRRPRRGSRRCPTRPPISNSPKEPGW